MKSIRVGFQCLLNHQSSDSSEGSQKSQAIPISLIRKDWQLILDQDATRDDLKTAIDKCKELVMATEKCSYERNWIVRHLCELRFRLRELEDVLEDPKNEGTGAKVILGHHFIPRQLKDVATPTRVRVLCDHCTGIIWSVVQASFICADCNYCVHYKCVDHVTRICANIIASERIVPIDNICPEEGMHSQKYRCADCKGQFQLDNQDKYYDTTPRLCDYSGAYFCAACHWNNSALIPARIIHNWDFKLYKVSRASLQEINLFYERPVLKVEHLNSKLFIFVQNLSTVKKLRYNLALQIKYLFQCKTALDARLFENQLATRKHLALSPDMYSISDLVAANSGSLIDAISKISLAFETHIRGCNMCRGRGYICEICDHDEPVFPFDDGAILCEKCNSMHHRSCWVRKSQKCSKCIRIQKRELEKSGKVEEFQN